MVSNLNIVLDEGKIKYLPECIAMSYDKKIWNEICTNWSVNIAELCHCEVDEDPYFIREEMRPWICKKYCRTHNIIPFIPFLTFNISPNWKLRPKPNCSREGKLRVWNEDLIENFGEVIKLFFAISQRFKKIEYAIEVGSEGTHLHAHVVAYINPQFEKSVITQHHKGNLAAGFRKMWDRKMPKGCEGCLKGKFAIQGSVIRKPEYEQQKLDYLSEENKPEDHKNEWDLNWRKSLIYC